MESKRYFFSFFSRLTWIVFIDQVIKWGKKLGRKCFAWMYGSMPLLFGSLTTLDGSVTYVDGLWFAYFKTSFSHIYTYIYRFIYIYVIYTCFWCTHAAYLLFVKHICIYIYIYLHTYIYIYIFFLHIYIYIYVYIHILAIIFANRHGGYIHLTLIPLQMPFQ